MSTEQELMQEDWRDILRRPGMNVLAAFLSNSLAHTRSRLENPSETDDFNKVNEVRGEMRGIRKVIQYIKKEYDRAAKSDTPEKEQ